MKNMKNNRVINVYEVYFRRDNKKQAVLVNSRREANQKRADLKKQHRKFLGMREVSLIEL